jgi:methionyl aminopeptidase
MIPIKKEKEIKLMKEGGRKLALVFGEVVRKIKPGVSLKQLNDLAEELIIKQGGFPSFKTVKGYRWATCININEGVVHGIPNEYQIKDGDLVSLDMGMLYKGFHTDMARTLWVQNPKCKFPASPAGRQNPKFLEAGKEALKAAVKAAKAGNRVGHISATIEKVIRKAGFSPVEDLTGHGVGKKLHEDPQIPCFLAQPINKTPVLQPGMTLAIEVIYTWGKPDLVLAEDSWTIKTADGKPAGLFENTVLVTKKEPVVLTDLEIGLNIC